MNLTDARALYEAIVRELKEKGLDLNPPGQTPWRFKLDKASVRFGCCNYTRRTISLSAKIVSLNGPDKVGACIRHEIAHALVGKDHGHDWVWKQMAVRCGDTGDRCYSDAEVATPDAPWQAVCPGCKRVVKKHRAPKPGRKISCGVCSPGRFDARFILQFTSTLRPAFERIAAFVPGQPNVVRVNEEKDSQVAAVLAMRMKGMGYVAIDAAFGIYGKKGWWSWKIVKDNS